MPITGQTIGVSGGVSDRVFQSCLRHMQEWQTVAAAICSSEFPNFRLLHAFRVLDIDVEAPLAEVGNTGRAGHRRMQEHVKQCVGVLAKFFDLQEETLHEEFVALKPLACQEMTESGCSVQEAWQRILQTRHRSQSYTSLRKVLQHYLVHDGSTSIVERSFAVTRKAIKAQQGNSSEVKENILTKILLDCPTQKQQLEPLIKRAREVWSEAFGIPRASGPRRRRKRLRPSGGDSDDDQNNHGGKKHAKAMASEAAFLRTRKASIDGMAEAHKDVPKQATCRVCLGATALREIEFQKKRKFARMVEAYDQGILDRKHVTPKFKQKLRAHKENQAKNNKKRDRDAARKQALCARSEKDLQISCKQLRQQGLYVDAAANNHNLKQWLRKWHCSCSEKRLAAGFFVVQDPNAPPHRITWVAILKGAYIATPDSFKADGVLRGPLLKLVPALQRKFRVQLLPTFRKKHPVFTEILKQLMREPSSKWTECRQDPSKYKSGKTLVFCTKMDEAATQRHLPKSTCKALTLDNFVKVFGRSIQRSPSTIFACSEREKWHVALCLLERPPNGR